jgi:hypothetical protein
MGLFDFFKKSEINFEGEKDLGKILNHGILFEDCNKLLKWGIPITGLAKQVAVKEKKFADRTVYNWGEHKILDGLNLELTTTYWNHREDSIDKLFTNIEFSVTGDDEAGKYFSLIAQHLEKKFGPGRHIEGEPDGCFEWVLGDVHIVLNLLQRVSNRLQLKIRWGELFRCY